MGCHKLCEMEHASRLADLPYGAGSSEASQALRDGACISTRARRARTVSARACHKLCEMEHASRPNDATSRDVKPGSRHKLCEMEHASRQGGKLVVSTSQPSSQALRDGACISTSRDAPLWDTCRRSQALRDGACISTHSSTASSTPVSSHKLCEMEHASRLDVDRWGAHPHLVSQALRDGACISTNGRTTPCRRTIHLSQALRDGACISTLSEPSNAGGCAESQAPRDGACISTKRSPPRSRSGTRGHKLCEMEHASRPAVGDALGRVTSSARWSMHLDPRSETHQASSPSPSPKRASRSSSS